MKPIDFYDKMILQLIQENGRIPIVELAQKINLSKSPCLQRLRRLERDGYIRGYRAELDPKKINQAYVVFVQVKLESTLNNTLEDFNNAVKKIPNILACHMISGGFDYLLKIRTSDMASYRALLGDVIARLPCVQQTSTFPVMEEVKDSNVLLVDGGNTINERKDNI